MPGISGIFLAIERSKRRKGQLSRAFFKQPVNKDKLAITTLADTYQRGYRNEWTGSTYCNFMVSSCNTFHRSSPLPQLHVGNHLSSDQPVSAGGPGSGSAGGRRDSCWLTFTGSGSGWLIIDHSLLEYRLLPARKTLGYRHINRFLAYERADSLQPSHYLSLAKSVQSITSGCVAHCGDCSQRYQVVPPAPHSRLAWAGALK